MQYVLLWCMMTRLVCAQHSHAIDVQGHRGARGLMPENTIAGFLRALDEKVNTLEMDVVMSKDKKIVVSHEPWISPSICVDQQGKLLDSTRTKQWNIYQMNYEQVAQFDCGIKPSRQFPRRITMSASKPLLSSVIVAVEDYIKSYTQYEVNYSIEIKSTPQGDNIFHPIPQVFSDSVYNIVNQYIDLDRLIIQSFDVRVLQYWHRKYPDIRLAALHEGKETVAAYMTLLGFYPTIYSPYYKQVTKKQVDDLSLNDIRVVPWTVNNFSDIQTMIAMGVDGLITDYPDSVVYFLDSLKKK